MAGAEDHEISERAFALWQKEGEPNGRSEEFWLRARSHIEAERERGSPADASASGHEPTLEKALEDTFPASDPPSQSGVTGPGG